MITLHHEFTFQLRMAGPLPSTKGCPVGERVYWEMHSGALMGSRMKAKMANRGGDWMVVGTDGLWRPDVRMQFLTEEGASVLLHYQGLVKPNAGFNRAAKLGQATEFTDQYMRHFMRFESGAKRYRWLTQELFLAEGRLAGMARIEYLIYRIG